jgi:hypothetical protein
MSYKICAQDLYFKDYHLVADDAILDTSAYFDNRNEQQVVQLINTIFERLEISNPVYIVILENFIRNYLPKNVHTQQQAILWLGLIINESGL